MGLYYAPLLLALVLGGGDRSVDLSPNNPLLKSDHGATLEDIRQEDIAIAEDKKQLRNKIKESFYWDVPISHDLQDYIRELCSKYGVEEQLAYAVMQVESGYDPTKISSTNDFGLFQINLINFERLQSELGISNFLDPFQNAHAGIFILGELTQKYGDSHMVLTSYNRGEGGAKALASRGGVITSYSTKVLTMKESVERIEQ